MSGPIIMTEEYWKNSQFSIAKYYGGMVFKDKHYYVVNKSGVTVRELCDPSSPFYVKGEKVIQPGEPCDLVLEDWIPVYKSLGRDKTIDLVKNGISLDVALSMINNNEQ